MIVTLFWTAVLSSEEELQCYLWPCKSRMTFPEALGLREYSVNRLMYKSVLKYDEFWFMYVADPGGKPSPNACFS
jgi:hypothetical protein